MDAQLTAVNQRVWYVEGGVHPARAPQFLAQGKFSDDPAQTLGEETKISAPDPNHYSRDIQVGAVMGAEERATFAISVRYNTQKSIIQAWAKNRCRVDFFALSGKCGNPQDFSEGGEKWTYFPDGSISDHSFENFGAFGLDENNPTNEAVSVTSETYWEFLYLRQDQIGASVTTREIYTVDVWQGGDCDDCPSVGDKVMMTMAGAAATPGTKPTLLYSADKGETWASQLISSMFSNENIVDSAIIGDGLVLLSNIANGFHWTLVHEIYEGINQWTDVVTGFVTGKSPNAMATSDVRHIWVVGDGGYIYFSRNFKIGVEVQDPGVATTQSLKAVSNYDVQNVLAVGNSNAVVYTSNGGSTWETITGPAVGVNLGSCWMWGADVWLVGEGANGLGRLWLTINRGVNWTQIGLPAPYVRIDKIKFVSEAEGYILARANNQSYVLRTITGGYEWVVLPNGKKGVPLLNSYLNDIAVTTRFSNLTYAVGLATNATNGIAIRNSG